MGNLFFPQLLSGALAQFPIAKKHQFRNVVNTLPDGSLYLFRDAGGSRTLWHLNYVELNTADVDALQSHFLACQGSVRAFTFIDPIANMLAQSENLLTAPWQVDSGLIIEAGVPDPRGGASGWQMINRAQVPQSIGQSFAIPANYQYCFSLYAMSSQGASLQLTRAGAHSTAEKLQALSGSWTRFISSGRLNDPGATFTVSLTLAPAQQIQVYGIQLEAQVEPSDYLPSLGGGGVYPNAHWAVSDFPVIAEGPGLFATSFTIETTN